MGAAQQGFADVVAYPPSGRVAAASLTVIARGSLLLTLAAILLADRPPTNPLLQIRLFLGLFAAPELATWCVARAFAARASVEPAADGATLVLTLRDRRIEVALNSIAGIEPWLLPLPRGGGLRVKLASGAYLPRTIGVADPVAFVDALIDAGASPSIRAGLDRSVVAFASARVAGPRGLLEHPALKFVLFSLLPTVPAFRLHQYITYGGTFGEYYTFGLKAYLLGFGLWWASWALGMVFVATAIRAVVEVVALGAAAAIPSYAAGMRRALEIAQRLLFYVGVPTWLALRLLA